MAKVKAETLNPYDTANSLETVSKKRNEEVHVTTFAKQRYYYREVALSVVGIFLTGSWRHRPWSTQEVMMRRH